MNKNNSTEHCESNNISSKLITSIHFAAIKHKDQRRKDLEETPYINHPIGVANYLVESGVCDLNILQAAILHDTVEDTDTSFEEIEAKFGKIVTDLVKEVTDDKTLPKLERKNLQIIKVSKSSTGAKQIKLADKLYNLKDLQRCTPVGWDETRVKEYFLWAHKVVSQINGVNSSLEAQLESIFKDMNIL